MLTLVVGVILVPGLLLLFEILAEERDRRRYPPPGRIASGSNLHVIEKGTTGTTVILESGLVASSISWLDTQARVAEFARVMAYDRGGLGWSAPRKARLTLLDLLLDLELLVQSSQGPVILVGHSFGGLLVGAFAHRYPEKIGGVLLVDPVSLATYSGIDKSHLARLQRGIRLSKRGALLARFGFVRLSLSLVARGSRRLPALIGRVSAGDGSSLLNRLAGEVAKLPRETYGPIRSHWSRPASFHVMAEYLRLLPEAASQASAMPIPADIPVIVLSAATARPSELAERDSWIRSHPASRHTQIPGTTHWLQLDRPELVAEAVRELALLIK